MDGRLSEKDLAAISNRYEQRYREYGYAPKTLDWDKGKQDLRFSILTSQFDFRGKKVIDIGCGFGDLNSTLKEITGNDYQYLGLDLAPSLLAEAETRYGDAVRVQFQCGDFLTMDLSEVDYAVASGTFNSKLEDSDNYLFIRQSMRKAFSLSRAGFAFNFLSDKVDFSKDHTFHTSPEKVLAYAYELSRNVMLLNHYMPFEFSLFVFKDDSFDPRRTIFKRWIESHPEFCIEG